MSPRRRALSKRCRAAICRVLGHRIRAPYRWTSWCTRCYRPAYAQYLDQPAQ